MACGPAISSTCSMSERVTAASWPFAQATAIHGIDLTTHQLPLIERLHPCGLCAQPGRLLDAPQRIAQRVGMTGKRLFLPPLGMPMPPIAACTDLHRGPAQLQQYGWFAKEHLAGSTQRCLLDKRQGG